MEYRALKRRLAAILVADVSGFSRLMDEDEAGTLAALKERHQHILLPLVRKLHGRIVKVMGDGVLLEFSSAVNAVLCAVELQKEMIGANAGLPSNRHILLRIGINLGDVIVEGGDLYGGGVNIAARLQAMAAPGDICITGSIREQVEKKVALDFEDLGAREMKNMARPVHVFRILAGGRWAANLPSSLTPIPNSAPSIAVLPFVNISGNSAQDCVADAITENLISDLSRFRDLVVIASHSTFAYKGKAVKIQDVSGELGVRYILEGSLQKSGNRLRINALLIDGGTGQHLWTERYDRSAEDLFTVQDEVTETIVGTLATGYGGRLRKVWRGRASGAGSRNLKAFDYFMRGIEHEDHFTKEDNKRARRYFTKAVQLDPQYGKAIAKVAWTHIFDALFDWGDDAAKSWANAFEFANLAVARDDDEAWGHWALGGYHLFRGHCISALVEYRKAVELNPSDADVLADFALCLSYAGQPREAFDLVRRAMRLNPHYPEWYAEALGHTYYDSHQYEEAVSTFENLRIVDTVPVHLYLAASYAALGRAPEASEAIGRVLELDPQARLERWTSLEKAPYKDPMDLEHLREDLRRAGLPR